MKFSLKFKILERDATASCSVKGAVQNEFKSMRLWKRIHRKIITSFPRQSQNGPRS